MNKSYPCIRVCDIDTSIEWYRDFLGLTCTYRSSLKQPDFALVESGSTKLFLAKDPAGKAYASNMVIIETSDIEETYRKLEAAGVIVKYGIGEGSFGTVEFAIKDYEDNMLIYRQNA